MQKKHIKNITRSIVVATSIMIGSSSFASQLQLMPKQSKWGYQDKSGREVISAKYDGAVNFSEGLAAVSIKNMSGFINKAGQEVIPLKYNGVNSFINGLAAVSKNNKWGFIDKTGKEIVPIIYDAVTPFWNGSAVLLKGDKWGIVDQFGNIKVDFIYDELYRFDLQGKANAKKGNKWGKVNKQGEVIVPFVYNKSEIDTEVVDSQATLTVNQEQVDLDIYNIDGNTYSKLRDIAAILKDTEKQFEVSFDQENKVVDLLSQQEYTMVGGEFEKNKAENIKAKFNENPIAKDGEKIEVLSYNIDDNNYFKIRDIAQVFNIGLRWNQETKTIEIDTSQDYIEN